jgi:hypothetical protein
MKLLGLAFLFCTLVASAGVPKLFEFNDAKDIKDDYFTRLGKSYLQLLKENTNKILSEIAAIDLKLEVNTKTFLDFMQNLFFSFKQSYDIDEVVKLEIAYETIAVFLQLKLESFGMNDSFFIDIYSMFDEYEKHTRKKSPQSSRNPFPQDFVSNMIQTNENEFTKEEFNSMSKESPMFYYDLYKYLISLYLNSLDKDQFIKVIFQGNFPQSTENLLRLSNDDFKSTVKGLSENLRKALEEYFGGLERAKRTNELHNVAFPKLYNIALPEIKKFKWLDVAPVQSPDETKTTSSKPNPGGNGNDQGLFDGKGKIVAICAVVIFISLLCGGIAFWRLRLRNKTLIAPSS